METNEAVAESQTAAPWLGAREAWQLRRSGMVSRKTKWSEELALQKEKAEPSGSVMALRSSDVDVIDFESVTGGSREVWIHLSLTQS
jgi:hypothetical protein